MKGLFGNVVACSLVILMGVALLLSLLVLLQLFPVLTGPTIVTRPPLHSGVGRLAFVSQVGGGTTDIALMPADGAGQINLTNTPALDATPSWSPDGQHLAFATYTNNQWHIAITNLNGVITPVTTPGWDPTWSPDGRRLAFVSEQAGSDDLYTIRVDGSDLRRLTTTAEREQRPVWAPDGRHLAYTVFRPDEDEAMEVIASDGTHPTRLGSGYGPAWSPDGRHLAFTSTSPPYGLVIIQPDGSGMRQLTDGIHPTWSADGSHIAFIGSSEKKSVLGALKIIRADGSDERLLVDEILSFPPQWSPDGQWIVFTAGLPLSYDYTLCIVNIAGTERTTLANGHDPVWQPRP